jgi:hypothetical protein
MAERFTKRPLALRARRRDREFFLRGLINRTRLNSGICFSLVAKMQNPSAFRFCERLQNWNVRGGFLKNLKASSVPMVFLGIAITHAYTLTLT